MRTLTRLLTLALVLAVTGLVVPDSSRASTHVALVKIEHAEAVALDRDTVWILGVGSDARPGEDMTRTRGDALQLIGLDTATGAATTIGIPRDSYVAIPGVGSDRINAALYYGGPQLLGEAVYSGDGALGRGFQRGVAHYPLLDEDIFLATPDELVAAGPSKQKASK